MLLWVCDAVEEAQRCVVVDARESIAARSVCAHEGGGMPRGFGGGRTNVEIARVPARGAVKRRPRNACASKASCCGARGGRGEGVRSGVRARALAVCAVRSVKADVLPSMRWWGAAGRGGGAIDNTLSPARQPKTPAMMRPVQQILSRVTAPRARHPVRKPKLHLI